MDINEKISDLEERLEVLEMTERESDILDLMISHLARSEKELQKVLQCWDEVYLPDRQRAAGVVDRSYQSALGGVDGDLERFSFEEVLLLLSEFRRQLEPAAEQRTSPTSVKLKIERGLESDGKRRR